jgi:sodium/hydrogen antiporter
MVTGRSQDIPADPTAPATTSRRFATVRHLVEHGLDTGALAIVAGCFVLWGLVSARLERWNVTAPIAFVAMGLAVAHEPLALIDVHLTSTAVRGLAEITLALVLFSDASRVNPRALRADVTIPVRLLGIGLPLTVAAGTAVAAVLFGGVDLWVAAVIGAIVAPTDAALGASILQDRRVPARVRRILNVESGLNDGIITPVVNLFIAGAVAAEVANAQGVGDAVVDLLIGAGVGVGVGLAGAALMQASERAKWSAPAFRTLAVLGLAVVAYAAAIQAGGNGFVGAFVGGLAFGSVTPANDAALMSFNDDAGELLSMLVWFMFGAAMIVPAFQHLVWQDVVFAVAALTVVRMVPVAIALIGSGLDRSSVAFIGWFGPRGLASVVFVLIAYDSLDPADGNQVLAAVTTTVVLSVIAHGVTAGPLSARYGRHASSLHPDQPEHAERPPLRTRLLTGRRARTVPTPTT